MVYPEILLNKYIIILTKLIKKVIFIVLNIPNVLTIIRIIGSICLPFLLLVDANEAGCFFALLIFVFCSLTDFLDGYLARKLNLQTDLGKMLDPIADKLLVILVLSCLVLVYGDAYNYLLGVPSILIIAREIIVSGIREFFGSTKGSFAVTKLSKFKTGVQMIAIICLLLAMLRFFEDFYFFQIGVLCLWMAAMFALYTGLVYVRMAIYLLSKGKK